MELTIIMLITLLIAPVVEFTTGIPRIVLGVIFLLFFPGYTMMAALFPRRDVMQLIERIVLSFVLSVALVPLVGLILNYTPWGIRLWPIFVSIASLVFVFSFIALYRRKYLPKDERFELRVHIGKLKIPRWGGATKLDKVLYSLLILSVLGAIGALFYVVTTPKAGDVFTDFYVLGSGGMAQEYPRQLLLGEQSEVTLGIVNHEHQDTSYRIEVLFNGEENQVIGPVVLADEEKWENKFALVLTKAGKNQKVEFFLYKGGETEPSLTLHLWLDVIEKQ